MKRFLLFFGCMLLVVCSQANALIISDLIGDKDGFGMGLTEGDARPTSPSFFFDNRTIVDPEFSDHYPVDPSFSYIHNFSSLSGSIVSAELNLFTLGIQDGDTQVFGSNTDITLSLDGNDIVGAFDSIDQFVFTTEWVEVAGLVSVSIPNSLLYLIQDGAAQFELNTLQLGTHPGHDAFAIDYSELVLNVQASSVPEPTTLVLMILGLLSILIIKRITMRSTRTGLTHRFACYSPAC